MPDRKQLAEELSVEKIEELRDTFRQFNGGGTGNVTSSALMVVLRFLSRSWSFESEHWRLNLGYQPGHKVEIPMSHPKKSGPME